MVEVLGPRFGARSDGLATAGANQADFIEPRPQVAQGALGAVDFCRDARALGRAARCLAFQRAHDALVRVDLEFDLVAVQVELRIQVQLVPARQGGFVQARGAIAGGGAARLHQVRAFVGQP